MNVYLVHHADAVSPAIDAERPLSELGREQAAWLAAEASRAGIAPAVIWHSGKRRARQTGEALLAACNPFARFQMVRGLSPDDRPDLIATAIAAEDRDVMVVGHMPHLPALAVRLSGGADPFPLHGLIWLKRTGDGAYEEVRRLQPPR